MSNTLLKKAQIVGIMPIMALNSGLPYSLGAPSPIVSSTDAQVFSLESAWFEARERERNERASKIDAYFRERHMPLEGMGESLAMAAEENGLDWRLLPAIAVRESSGGKQMCGYNPFGWASCRVRFESVKKAINTVALHLGGGHPNTERYYKGRNTREILYRYNGTVIPTYMDEVIDIMESIEDQDTEALPDFAKK